MRLQTGYEERRARVEMTPLMDVVFLLLVFFIYAMFSMSTHRGVRVSLPRGPASREAGPVLTITIRADDTLQIEGREGAAAAVLSEAVERHRRDGWPVLISADRRARLGTGIELLARLKDAGVDAVAFQLEAEPREHAP
jgi:biopolymer transport protein ExbD